MRVFVAGATGYVGSSVTQELLEAGHEVIGLARSDEAATVLEAFGAMAHRGNLTDLDSLREGAALSDGVIFAANQHISQTADPVARAQAELAAVDAIGEELVGSGKPFVVTSGVLGRQSGTVLTEQSTDQVNGLAALRMPVENSVLARAGHGVRSSSVRLAPTVHGPQDARGFVSTLIGLARQHGFSAYVGPGHNRWPSVHRRDAAVLYRLALESAPPGSVLHAVAEPDVPFREMAEAIARNLGVAARSLDPDQAREHFGFLAPLVALDSPATSDVTRRDLGWKPDHPMLIEDIDGGVYT